MVGPFSRSNLPASSGDTAQVSVDNSGTTLIVAANPTRQAVIITNLGTNDVYIGYASGVTTSTGDILVGTKGAFVTIPTTAALYGVVSSTSQSVSVMEIY
jgi:hypothetical protein